MRVRAVCAAREVSARASEKGDSEKLAQILDGGNRVAQQEEQYEHELNLLMAFCCRVLPAAVLASAVELMMAHGACFTTEIRVPSSICVVRGYPHGGRR